MKKIIICGGHLTPALALIEELRQQKDVEIIFIGRKYATEGSKNLSAEYKTVKNLNVDFYKVTAGRLQRKFTLHTIPALLKIPIGYIQSLYILVKVRPQLVVSFGGYISSPVVFNAWLLGIKSITHEQSVKLGLANKINALFNKKVYLSWQQTASHLKEDKYHVIGNLTRHTVFKKTAKDVKIQKFLSSADKLIFVTGGNQGSHFINKLIFEMIPQLSSYQIIHQVGTANFKGDLDKAKKIKRANYLALDYIGGDNIGAIFDRADLVISRSGANTVWDLAILGKVAILIPLPIAAAGEQEANANILLEAGSAIILNQKDLSPQILAQKIDHIFKSLPKFQRSAQTFSKTLPKSASKTLASEVLKLTEN